MQPKLSTTKKRALKAKAHHLKPVVMIGNLGLTDNARMETDAALDTHELIKVRINAANKDTCCTIATDLCTKLDATLVQLIGHVAVLYRENEKT